MTKWEEVLKNHPESNFLQSEPWQKVNELIGHKTILKLYDDVVCLMIIKNAKRGRFMEIPGGPIVDWQNKKLVRTIFDDIKSIAKAEKCVFVRLRPQLRKTDENLTLLKNLGLKPSPMHLAAEHTVILDMTKSEDELYAEMRRQTRYEVKRSQKIDLEVEKLNDEKIFQEFYKVQQKTAERQNFFPPNLKTLLAEREAFGADIAIYRSKTGENTVLKEQKYTKNLPLAYGLVLKNGVEAEYYEAASTDPNYTLPGAYALQRAIIHDLKDDKNITRYNLWGIAPPDSPHHRYAGVTTFKKGFGGEVVEFVPAHDLVINKVKYLPNLIIETARKKRRHL